MAVSATTGDGFDDLLAAVGHRLRRNTVMAELSVPYDRGDVLAMAHREGEVLDVEEDAEGWTIRVRVDEGSAGRLAEYRTDTRNDGEADR